MHYAPAEKSQVTSLEFVEFNSSVTLSQQYAILGKVAKEIGKVYEKSGDENLAQLAKGYYTMEEEAKHLSKLVEKHLPEYNRVVFGVIEGKVVVDSSFSIDPELILNGGFETGTSSSWTTEYRVDSIRVSGYGDHRVTSEDRHSGSYSMLIGYKYSDNVASTRDWVYQTITIPSDAINVQLSFYYHLYTEDSASFDWFEVYVRSSYGSNLAQVFKKGGANAGGLEEFGWAQVTYDLSAYAGQTVQIYFAVANWYDTLYKTWVYIDDVSVTYEVPQPPSYEECVRDCLWAWCLLNWYYCYYVCGGSCACCFAGGLPCCVPCAICVGGVSFYCLLRCL